MQASNWGDKFSHVAMKDLARFSTTFNSADQTIAADTNIYNIQSTGTGACVINGVFVPALPVDAVMAIITEQAAPTALTDQFSLLADTRSALAVNDEVYTGILTGVSQKFYKVLVAHQASYDTQPADNPQLFQAIPNADTLSLVDDATLWVMVTAEVDGTLGLWIASDAIVDVAVAPTLAIPYFDPSVYCVVAFGDLTNVTGSATGIIGAIGTGAGYISMTEAADVAWQAVLGPVYPAIANMPKN